MRNEIKISFTGQRFYVDQKHNEVICVLSFKPLYPLFIKFVLRQMGCLPLTAVRCVARLKDGDTFDLEKGQKVALAKAENRAYRAVNKQLKKIQEYLKLSDWQISSFDDKVNNVIEHNTQYINKF